jgi:hypothetical protein
MRIYKTVLVPTLLYGTESLTVLDKRKNRMQASEMKYLKKSDWENQKWPDKEHNNKKPTEAILDKRKNWMQASEMKYLKKKWLGKPEVTR